MVVPENNGVVFGFIGPIDYKTEFILVFILRWFEAVNLPKPIWHNSSFSDCPIVAFLSCWIVLSDTHIFKKYLHCLLFYFSVLQKNLFLYNLNNQTGKIWTNCCVICLDRFTQNCIFIDYLDLMKKVLNFIQIDLSMAFNSGIKSTKLFHSCFFTGYFINVSKEAKSVILWLCTLIPCTNLFSACWIIESLHICIVNLIKTSNDMIACFIGICHTLTPNTYILIFSLTLFMDSNLYFLNVSYSLWCFNWKV